MQSRRKSPAIFKWKLQKQYENNSSIRIFLKKKITRYFNLVGDAKNNNKQTNKNTQYFLRGRGLGHYNAVNAPNLGSSILLITVALVFDSLRHTTWSSIPIKAITHLLILPSQTVLRRLPWGSGTALLVMSTCALITLICKLMTFITRLHCIIYKRVELMRF